MSWPDAHHGRAPGSAKERIVAAAADQQIVARTRHHRIAAGRHRGRQGLIADTGDQLLRLSALPVEVIARPAAEQRCRAGATEQAVVAILTPVDDGAAGAAFEGVAASTAEQRDRAGAAEEHKVPGPAEHQIPRVAGRVDGVVAAAGRDGVVAARLHAVLAAAELDQVMSAASADGVVAATQREDRVVATAGIDAPSAVVAAGNDDQVAAPPAQTFVVPFAFVVVWRVSRRARRPRQCRTLRSRRMSDHPRSTISPRWHRLSRTPWHGRQ